MRLIYKVLIINLTATDIKEIKVGRRIKKTSNIDMIDKTKSTSEFIVYEK